MARAAIVVVPSRWPEPFGLTALEAMACGAALLCSPRGGLPEAAGDAAQTIDPDDPAAMAAATCRRRCTDPARARRLAARRPRPRRRVQRRPPPRRSTAGLRDEILAGMAAPGAASYMAGPRRRQPPWKPPPCPTPWFPSPC